VLGEFFAARSEDLDEALVEEGPYGRLSTVEAKGLTEVSLATLGEILGVGTYDELVGRIGEGRPRAKRRVFSPFRPSFAMRLPKQRTLRPSPRGGPAPKNSPSTAGAPRIRWRFSMS
jgi:hypothetical protein